MIELLNKRSDVRIYNSSITWRYFGYDQTDVKQPQPNCT